ncbi:MAG: protoporphyrinogen oxidase HemJ [Myxococcota bacterium]
MLLLWLKAFHVVAMVAWFAGIFYLPRLFVYHAMARAEGDEVGQARFCVMERKLYRAIMTPSALVTIALGIAMVYVHGLAFLRTSAWLHAKLLLVVLLVLYHFWMGRLVGRFARGEDERSHVFYRWINELPVLLLVGVVVLVIVKPF